ncbi:MAG: biopolymer transporter ExbD [Verrucomicrobiaceae bacterium]|nr:biopolymer transporter ExbD [Verrucomicrobiaceae bacterium]
MSLNLRPRRRPVPTIPIVSLIDIMVVLLIFVVATTTFKKNQTRMEIALPSSKSLGTTTSAPDARITLGITKADEIFLDATPVKIENLPQALKTLRAGQPSARLELEADTASTLGTLLKVWDALKEAGIPITDVPARIQRATGG